MFKCIIYNLIVKVFFCIYFAYMTKTKIEVSVKFVTRRNGVMFL